jgi:PKD repeat protein
VIALSLADDDGGTGTASASAVVNNLDPTLSISAPAYGTLYALNTTVSLTALVSDASSYDTLTCSVDWDNGTTTSGTISADACSAGRTYSAAGVYTIEMTVVDDDSGSDTESVLVVVYDASAGFVTGGSWINSPAGAYKPDQILSSQATFGFVSKYHKGANVPEGNTEFEFATGGFEFASSSYEWLVVNQDGSNAQFKGTGLVNSAPDPNSDAYKFMVWASDGANAGIDDTFRIRIWWEDSNGVEHDVYDSGVNQTLGGGNIVIHKDR